MVVTKDRYIPFGPFLALGGAAVFLFGRELQALFGAFAG
jgi:prepilin signal peptidase PulO-like enzyme (type II secretory pathway)